MAKYGFGTRVMIYEDPITKQKPEGMATLKELYKTLGSTMIWRVHFDGDAENEFYERSIEFEDGDEILSEETED